MNQTESELLLRAVQLALDNVENGGEPFGALVVRDGRVVATGVNSAVSDADRPPTPRLQPSARPAGSCV